MQQKQTEANRLAWNTKAYEAWLINYGTPAEAAEKFRQDPKYPLRRWLKYIGEPTGQRIINLLGSSGGKAIPLAILGANVTVVDISAENMRYALEVSEAAKVTINFINADVLNIPNEEELRYFDIVLMEFGILHYFSELDLIFSVVTRMLKPNGRFILTDFHPFASKLLSDSGSGVALKEGADYFDTSLRQENIAYTHLLPEDERESMPKVLLRKWTFGEILSMLASKGFYLRILEEEPNPTDKRFPGFYTLVADKLKVALSPLTP